jgi:hypothetical protein
LKKFVVDQLVLGVAVLTKRSLFDVSDQDRESILVHLNQLLGMEAENAVSIGNDGKKQELSI